MVTGLWAGGRSAVGLVATIAGWGRVGSQLALKGAEVILLGDGGARDRDETVAGALLGVLVDKTAGVDWRHLILVVQSGDSAESAGVGDASVLGKEERNAVVAVGLNLGAPARALVRRRVTPGVVVEGEEVAALVVGTAVHVCGHLVTVAVDISSGVADGDSTVATAVAVLLEVASDSLNVRSAVGGVVIVDDFVTGEEKEGVGVVGESVYCSEETLQVNSVVGRGRAGPVDGVLWSVDIESNVDSSVGERAHALVVACSVVDSVYSDGVDAKLLEVCDVALAGGGIRKWVFSLGGTTWLVVDTANVETVVAGPESCGRER